MKAAGTALIILLLAAGLRVAAGGAALTTLGTAAALAAGSGNPVSMDQAVKMVEQRFQARVVKAETQKDGVRTVYALRLYDKSSGKVWTVHVDAADGSIH
ncbi:MAG TPA: PepSY domain-containing protein [Steroidobacteraceae bacterium]|nr:PepSY domain-containing protein [Steroidobacteraceae bacterium]